MEQVTEMAVQPADKKKIWGIWKVAIILGVVTAIEYVFAFNMPRGLLLNVIFVTLTIVKAFYIVSEFMHLGHEVKGLVWSIILPMIFILWLIVALVNVEGSAVKDGKGIEDFEGAKIELSEPTLKG